MNNRKYEWVVFLCTRELGDQGEAERRCRQHWVTNWRPVRQEHYTNAEASTVMIMGKQETKDKGKRAGIKGSRSEMFYRVNVTGLKHQIGCT